MVNNPPVPPGSGAPVTLLDQKRPHAAAVDDSSIPAYLLAARRWWRAFLMLGGKDEYYEGAIAEAQTAKVEMERAAREFETTLQNVTLTSTKCLPVYKPRGDS